MWPPPEGTAPMPPEEKNPLIKLLMDVSSSQESLLEDHLLLTNRFNIHRCSDYCLTLKSGKNKIMSYGVWLKIFSLKTIKRDTSHCYGP